MNSKNPFMAVSTAIPVDVKITSAILFVASVIAVNLSISITSLNIQGI